MAVALLDSSAVVAYLTDGDTLHDDAVQAIESTVSAGTPLAISAVSWSELLNGALLGHLPENELREFVADFGIDILGVDADVAEHAAALQNAYRQTSKHEPRPKLRTPDALILATSVVDSDVEIVICGDEQWTKIPGVDAEIMLIEKAKGPARG